MYIENNYVSTFALVKPGSLYQLFYHLILLILGMSWRAQHGIFMTWDLDATQQLVTKPFCITWRGDTECSDKGVLKKVGRIEVVQMREGKVPHILLLMFSLPS